MKFEAIVYGWRNLVNGKIYIGFHKTSEIHDGYITSSEDDEMNEAWSYGLLQRFIIFKGTVSEAITLENFALKYAKANLEWDNFYNNSVGGGEGCVKDFSNLTDEMKQVAIDFMNGINPPEEKKKTYKTFDRSLVQAISEAVKNGKYKKVDRSVDEIFGLERNQVRLNTIHEDKVEQIADLMRNDPAKSRQNVEPVIVCVYQDGSEKIIDGNHTINASKRAKWKRIDVVYINFSDFLFNHSNVNAFGYQMNHSDKIKTPNSSADCQRAIINIYHDLVDRGENVDISSAMFKNTVMEDLDGWWTPRKIAQNLKSAIVRVRTDEANAKRNFRKWTNKELEAKMKEIQAEDKSRAVIRITSGSCYNAGVGAIMNKMGGMNTNRGMIMISHNNIDEYDHWNSSEQKMLDALTFLRDDVKIEYVVLDAFEN